MSLIKFGGAGYCRVSYAQRVTAGTWSSGGAGRVNLDEFQHVAVTVAGPTLKAYVDGQLVLTKQDVAPRVLDDEPVLIGKSPGSTASDCFKGVLDDVRIYNRALSAEEVAGLLPGGQQRSSRARVQLHREANARGRLFRRRITAHPEGDRR